MQSRRQANQLVPGDRLQMPLTVAFEVTGEPQHVDGVVEVPVKPVPCSDKCSTDCECHYSLFDGAEGPFPLRIGASQRVTFLGNLSKLLAESKRIQAQIARLQASQNGGDPVPESDGVDSAEQRAIQDAQCAANEPKTYRQ